MNIMISVFICHLGQDSLCQAEYYSIVCVCALSHAFAGRWLGCFFAFCLRELCYSEHERTDALCSPRSFIFSRVMHKGGHFSPSYRPSFSGLFLFVCLKSSLTMSLEGHRTVVLICTSLTECDMSILPCARSSLLVHIPGKISVRSIHLFTV
ncbi:mCG1027690 [Mus musculus]|nr:mCG1027690 [Mus musculus]